MRIRSSVSLIAMGVAIASAMPAAAQTAPGTLQPPSGSGSTSATAQTPADDFAAANDIRSSIVAGEQTATSSGDIVVTGTRIIRPNNRSAAPIVTTTAAEIQAQGATTIEEVLNRLPQVQVSSEQNQGDLTEGRQRVKLRALGFERTLSLIDGLRFGLANTIDTGIIPNALVERIDILSGGASSVYGADAVSGVVNYIMKKNFEGVRLDANYSFFNHDNRENLVTETARRFNLPSRTGMVNDGGRLNVTLSAGTNLFDNRVNLTSFINYRQSDSILLGDRSHSACELQQQSPTAPFSCFLASFVAAGTIIPRSGASSGRLLVNNPNGDGTFVPLNSGPGTAANPFDEQAYQRDFKRVNAGGFLTAEISDEIEFYSSLLFYRDESTNNILNRTLNAEAYGETSYQVNCDNPFLSASQASVLCGANAGRAGILAPLDVRYRFDGLPPVEQRFTNESWRAVAGLRGRGFGGNWTYDVAAMMNRMTIVYQGVTFPDFDRVNRSLNVVNVNGVPTCQSVVTREDAACVPFNAFRPYNADQNVADYLFPPSSGSNRFRVPRLFQALGTISGDLGAYGIRSPLAEAGVAVAFGVEYRDEMERGFGNEAFRLEQPNFQFTRVTQSILEANAEVSIPVIENRPWTELLEISAGYRISDYNALNGTFDTWKIEGIWSPITDITFRGSYNKSQRAPDVGGAAAAANVFFEQGFFSDPCATRPNNSNSDAPRLAPLFSLEQCRNTGLPDNLYATEGLNCPNEQCTVRQGGFNLTPESAFTKTFGIILRPRFLPGLTVSVDRWIIKIEDSLDFLQPQNALNECGATGIEFFCRAVARNPGTGSLFSSSFDSPTTGWVARGGANFFKSDNSGVDIQSQYNLGLGSAGRLDFGFNGSWMTSNANQPSPVALRRECIGYFGRSCGESLPKWAHQARATWSSPDRTTSISLNWRHRGAMPLDLYAPRDTNIPAPDPSQIRTFTGIGSFDWFDLALTFDVTQAMTFRVAANNIFDRDPPLVPNGRQLLEVLRSNSILGYDLLGRNIVVGVSLKM